MDTQEQKIIDRERKRILEKISPALNDFSKTGQRLIESGLFIKTGTEMIKNVGYIEGILLPGGGDSNE